MGIRRPSERPRARNHAKPRLWRVADENLNNHS
jgi:hypothetical protein